MGSHHESLADLDLRPVPGGDQRPAFRRAHGHRLLAKNVLAGFRRPNGPGNVQVIGQRDIDGLDVAISNRFFVAAVSLRNTKFSRGGLGFGEIARGNPDDFRVITLLHSGNHPACDTCSAQDGPLHFLRHKIVLLNQPPGTKSRCGEMPPARALSRSGLKINSYFFPLSGYPCQTYSSASGRVCFLTSRSTWPAFFANEN